MLKEDIEVLREVPIFASVELSKLKLLAFASQRMSFDPGQVLCREGDFGDTAYVIIQGAAEVCVRAGDSEITVASLGRNDFVGDMAILCDTPRTATVRASSRCETLVIGKTQLLGLLRSFPDMSIAMMRVLAGRLERTNRQLVQVQNERIAHH